MGGEEKAVFNLKHPKDKNIEKLVNELPELLKLQEKKGMKQLKSGEIDMSEEDQSFVNIDFFEWLKNRSMQTDIYVQDQRKLAKDLIAEYRKQPGPGEYEHSHYSTFFKYSAASTNDVSQTKASSFGLTPKCEMPNYMKAPGIGDSCNEFMAPNTYKPNDSHFSEMKLKKE